MLGHVRKTTRLDVGLAFGFTGASFLAWALVARVSRTMMLNLIYEFDQKGQALPDFSQVIKLFFVNTGFVIDLVGLAWLLIGMMLVFFAARQKISISWAWMCGMIQIMAAAIGAIIAAAAIFAPLGFRIWPETMETFEVVSEISFPIVLIVAVLIWSYFLYRLIRGNYKQKLRGGPTPSDSSRSNYS